MRIERYKGSRFWALYDEAGTLVVVTVYKRGAAEVQRRLTGSQPVQPVSQEQGTQDSYWAARRTHQG